MGVCRRSLLAGGGVIDCKSSGGLEAANRGCRSSSFVKAIVEVLELVSLVDKYAWMQNIILMWKMLVNFCVRPMPACYIQLGRFLYEVPD